MTVVRELIYLIFRVCSGLLLNFFLVQVASYDSYNYKKFQGESISVMCAALKD